MKWIRYLFQMQVNVITDATINSVSLNMDGNCSVGGYANKIENRWVDRPWLKKLKIKMRRLR